MNRSENRLQDRPDREISQNVSLVSVRGYSREVDEPTAVLSWQSVRTQIVICGLGTAGRQSQRVADLARVFSPPTAVCQFVV